MSEVSLHAPQSVLPHEHLLPHALSRKIARKVDTRLPGKGKSDFHGARPIHQIISIIKWIRTSRLSIKNSLSPGLSGRRDPWT